LWPEQEQRVWQRWFYDFNVWSERKRVEKLRYMHSNPEVRPGAGAGTMGAEPAIAVTRLKKRAW